VAINIDPTVGGASANSYVTLAEANSYFASRLGTTAWDNADADTRSKALIMAANRIEAELYRGTRVSADQRLAWPRAGVWLAGLALASTAVPALVKQAQMEEALALLDQNTDEETGDIANPFAPSGTENLKSLRAGDIDLEFRDRDASGDNPSAADDPSQTFASPQAYRLLRPYLVTQFVNTPSGARNVRLTRGG
jgi:hypothetical protein